MTTKSQKAKGGIPVTPLINPLTEADRIAIEYVLERLPEIADLLRRAEACGLDVSDRKDKHAMHTEIAAKLQEHFFPTNITLPTGND
jgi:hypothetical protein